MTARLPLFRPARAAGFALTSPLAPDAVAQQGPLRGFDAYTTQAIKSWDAPGLAVAVIRNDSVVLARGYGVREAGKADPVTANTLFAVGSTTKAFTAALLGTLVDAGKLSWDDPVTKHDAGLPALRSVRHPRNHDSRPADPPERALAR